MNSNNDIDNSYKFFVIWRNHFLKNYILNEIRFFNFFKRSNKPFSLQDTYIAFSYEDYLLYRYKYYITKLSLKNIPTINNNSNNSINNSNNNNNIYKISENVTHLILKDFNNEIDQNLEYLITPTTKHLILKKYNQSLIIKSLTNNSSISIIPNFITTLELEEFNKSLERSLPDSITKLVLNKFNQVIEIGDLPNSLTSLKFNSFNQKLKMNSLPNNITYLDMGYNYNFILIENIIPSSTKHLRLPLSYSHPINVGVLPYGIEILEIGRDFQSTIAKYALPDSITKLNLGDFYNPSLENLHLPSSLKSIVFSNSFNPSSIPPNWLSSMCKSIDSVMLGYRFKGILVKDSIPSTVNTLSLYFNQEISEETLPDNLKNLSLSYYFNSNIKKLPNSLEFLRMQGKYNLPFHPNLFPNTLTRLELLCLNEFSYELPPLPSSITYLSAIGFKKPIKDHVFANTVNLRKLKLSNNIHTLNLPNSITSFTFDGLFDCDKFNLNQLTNLKSLKIHLHYSRQTLEKSMYHLNKIKPNYLPNSITKLHFPLINQDITQDLIPPNVTTLSIDYPLKKYRIEEFAIPNKVTKLTINYSRDSLSIQSNKCYKLKKDMIPSSVTNLKLRNFKQPLDSPSILPNSITSLNLGDEFNFHLNKQNTPSSLFKCKVGFIPKDMTKDLLKDVIVIRKYYE